MPEADFSMRVEGAYVGSERIASVSRNEIVVTLQGVEGDRHMGFAKRAGIREKRFHEKGTEIFNARQWSALSVEEMAEVARDMGLSEVKAEWLGANLLFSGYAGLTQLPGLTRLIFPSGATLLVYAENLPCKYPADAMQEKDSIPPESAGLFVKAAMGKRGLVGWVERAGTIRIGDHVSAYLPK